jgi:hypothetical protein
MSIQACARWNAESSMRLALWLVGAATGALSVAAILTVLPQHAGQTFRTAEATSGKVNGDSKEKIRSPDGPIKVRASTPIISFPTYPTWSVPRWDFRVDDRAVMAAGYRRAH